MNASPTTHSVESFFICACGRPVDRGAYWDKHSDGSPTTPQCHIPVGKTLRVGRVLSLGQFRLVLMAVVKDRRQEGRRETD